MMAMSVIMFLIPQGKSEGAQARALQVKQPIPYTPKHQILRSLAIEPCCTLVMGTPVQDPVVPFRILRATPRQEEIEAAREARKKFDLCPGFTLERV